MAYYLLALSTILTLTAAQTPDSQCFWKRDRTVISEGDGWYACNNTATAPGGAQLCCQQGSECGPDSLCHFPTGNNGGSGWYLGGCTDGSWNDPVCTKSCTKFDETWVLWNNTEQLWRCCGDDICSGTPSNVTFQAVAPQSWSAVPSTATATATATATSTSTATGNSTNGKTTQSKNSGGLSTGAQAGIGVGVGIVGLAVVAGIAIWFLRKRRRNGASYGQHDAEQMKQVSVYGGDIRGTASPTPAYDPPAHEQKKPMQQTRSEMPGSEAYAPQELGSERQVAELPGDEARS